MLKGLDERTAGIYAPVQSQLICVEERLRSLSGMGTPDLEPLLDHVLTQGGKRVRPAITLLASEFYPHETESPIIMASAVELLHLATLIHDDTVDNSDLRRGRATVGRVWGHHVAVLFGDYVFATSATFVCDTQNIRVIRRFSETIMELASGELTELFHAFDVEQARELYHDRIYRKTASLFCTASESGAILGGAPEPQIQALRSYGYNIGMAFQIVDDLLDVRGDSAQLGKPVGMDLQHGILTLPTIMLLERYPEDNPVKALFDDRTQDGLLEKAVDMINNTTVMDDCRAVVREYCEEASQALETLPDCQARRSLLDLAEYVRQRNR